VSVVSGINPEILLLPLVWFNSNFILTNGITRLKIHVVVVVCVMWYADIKFRREVMSSFRTEEIWRQLIPTCQSTGQPTDTDTADLRSALTCPQTYFC
jgi:hypothetical protein